MSFTNIFTAMVAGVGAITAVTTAIISIFSAYGDMVTHFHDIDIKLSSIQEDIVTISGDLNTVDDKLEINSRRWAIHYGLWGESIESRGSEAGVETDILRPEN